MRSFNSSEEHGPGAGEQQKKGMVKRPVIKKYKKFSVLAVVAFLGMGLAACSGDSGRGDAIVVVSREDGSGTRGAFTELFGIVEKGLDGSKKDRTTKEAIVVNKTAVMLATVAQDQNAIGYGSLGSLNDKVKPLMIDGVEPTAENISTGAYSLFRPFLVATKKDSSELARDFIGFMLSQEGQAVVAKDYISVAGAKKPYGDGKKEGKLTIAGSSSVTPIMEKLREAYIKINPKVQVEIQMSDSTSGLNAVMEGTVDIGMASRDLRDSELKSLEPTAIALDGIVVIVNPANPVPGLSKEDIFNIFTGKIEDWRDFNGSK